MSNAKSTKGCIKTAGLCPAIENKLIESLNLLGDDCPDVKQKIQETLEMVSGLNHYAASKSTPMSPITLSILEEIEALDFEKLYKEGKMKTKIPANQRLRMISFTGQVQFLQFLIRSINAKSILEVGTYMGYGAFGMAEAMAAGGKVTGIDIEPYFCSFVNKKARDNNLNIEIKEGPALEVMSLLASEANKYDFIYIDCVKFEYEAYFKTILDNNMLLPGGIIVCDNIMLNGVVMSRGDDNGKAMDDFNNMVLKDGRVTAIVLPCYDGLSIYQHVHGP